MIPKFRQTFPAGKPDWRHSGLIVLFAVIIVATANTGFHDRLIAIYPWNDGHNGFLVSFFLFHCALITLLIAFISLVLPAWAVVTFFVVTAAVAGYFINQYGSVIDTEMLQNILLTDSAEAWGLVNIHLFLNVLLTGVVPGYLLWRFFPRLSLRQTFGQNCALMTAATMVMLGTALSFGDHYADLFREHRVVRYYANPAYPVYAAVSYVTQQLTPADQDTLAVRMPDAHVPAADVGSRLVILVVGETARRDRFSLNGYERDTNPRLSQVQGLLSYQKAISCGTSTAYSVPCMFAIEGADEFESSSAGRTENVLDVLQRAGVDVLWRDNNSSSKGVADRVIYQDYRSPTVNPECDIECRDVGMLHGLQAYIDSQPHDVLIVLHQMGNHGPEYFKRYPPEFERFTPACHSSRLNACTPQEINNAYDNAIVYTDFFLAEVINLLQANASRFQTSMLYVSDHGESLGENGVYLHGLPLVVAPKQQLEIPIILWAAESSDIDLARSRHLTHLDTSHDALAASLLTLFEVESLTPLATLKYFAMKEDVDSSLVMLNEIGSSQGTATDFYGPRIYQTK